MFVPLAILYKEWLSPCQIRHQGNLDNEWHEVAYPVIILKSYDHFGTVVHSQTLHIEITPGCWYSPLEADHLEGRRLAVLFADTLLLQLASGIMSSDMINLFYSSVKTIPLSRAYLIVYIPPHITPFFNILLYCRSLVYWVINSYFRVTRSVIFWIQGKQGHVLIAREWEHSVLSHVATSLTSYSVKSLGKLSKLNMVFDWLYSYFVSFFNLAVLTERAYTWSTPNPYTLKIIERVCFLLLAICQLPTSI